MAKRWTAEDIEELEYLYSAPRNATFTEMVTIMRREPADIVSKLIQRELVDSVDEICGYQSYMQRAGKGR